MLARISGRPGWANKPQSDELHDVAATFNDFLGLLLCFESDLEDMRDELEADDELDLWMRDAQRVDDFVGTWGSAWRRARQT